MGRVSTQQVPCACGSLCNCAGQSQHSCSCSGRVRVMLTWISWAASSSSRELWRFLASISSFSFSSCRAAISLSRSLDGNSLWDIVLCKHPFIAVYNRLPRNATRLLLIVQGSPGGPLNRKSRRHLRHFAKSNYWYCSVLS